MKYYTGDKKKVASNIHYELNSTLTSKKCKNYLELYEKCLISEDEIIKCEILYIILEKCMNKIG